MADEKTILTRSQADPRFTWDLTDMYPSDEAWKQALEEAKIYDEKMLSYQGKMKDSPAALLELLKLEDEVGEVYDSLIRYPSHKLDEDTTDPIYQGMMGQVMAQYVALDAATSFVTPEILSISDGDMEAFYRQEPGLEHYRLALSRIRRQKAHTLSDGEEKLLAMAGEMAQAPENIFSNLADADLTFPDAVDKDGKLHPVTHGTFIPLLTQEDRVLRKSAFESLYGVYRSFNNTFAAALSGQTKQTAFYARARKYQSSLEAALDRTEVPVEVYINLIAAVHENMAPMHRYAQLRKDCLGVEELHMYDLYTPIVKDVEWKVSYEEAKEIILKALAPLGEDYLALLRKGFDERWIDVYENKGKRSGAYSSGARVHPYVLLNYQGNLNDMFTLAHEMGHSIHSYLSNEKQPFTYANYTIFVAEVASTCNEALLMEYLLSVTDEPKKRAYLVNYFLEQFRGTLYRQTMFAEFELELNRMEERGETITARALNELHRKLNEEYFGPAVCVDEEIGLEWSRIPHFYADYYVYQYATGYAAAIALSRQILSQGKEAVDRYLNFLSAGCSADPITLLRRAGVDMAGPEPVNQALTLFGELIDDLARLLGH